MTKRKADDGKIVSSIGALAMTVPRYIIHNGQWYVLKAHMAEQMQLAIEMADKSYAQRLIRGRSSASKQTAIYDRASAMAERHACLKREDRI